MTKKVFAPRQNALRDGRIKLNTKPTHVVKGPNGWSIVPDFVRA